MTPNLPPVTSREVDNFAKDIFGNILELRDCSKAFLDEIRGHKETDIAELAPNVIYQTLHTFADQLSTLYPDYAVHYGEAVEKLQMWYESNAEIERFFLVRRVASLIPKLHTHWLVM